IKKMIFFTPNFNDSKPDASNYSCAIVTDGNDASSVGVNNCEHFANACVLGITNSSQGVGEVGLIDISPFPFNFFNASRNFGSAIENSLEAINMPLNTRIRR